MKRTKKVLNFFSSQIQSVNNGLKDAINAGEKTWKMRKNTYTCICIEIGCFGVFFGTRIIFPCSYLIISLGY